tara:strand:- start:54 stop:338 length:285 start_codon:yes stop_codon:yes gene_type:complete
MRDIAIRNTHPTVVGINAGIDATDADGNSVILDESVIATEILVLQAAYDAQAYARSRKAEYPPWDEQLDHIYHNGVASWKANVVKPVKDKYPKP